MNESWILLRTNLRRSTLLRVAETDTRARAGTGIPGIEPLPARLDPKQPWNRPGLEPSSIRISVQPRGPILRLVIIPIAGRLARRWRRANRQRPSGGSVDLRSMSSILDLRFSAVSGLGERASPPPLQTTSQVHVPAACRIRQLYCMIPKAQQLPT
jgi:hypothetical protein